MSHRHEIFLIFHMSQLLHIMHPYIPPSPFLHLLLLEDTNLKIYDYITHEVIFALFALTLVRNQLDFKSNWLIPQDSRKKQDS